MSKIWVIEDEDVVAELVVQLLRANKYDVTRYAGGQEAIDALQTRTPPDLLILDLMMPPPDGNDVLALVAKLGHPPVLILTAYPGHLHSDYYGIPVGVISKPFRFEELLRSVDSAISYGERRAGS